LLDAHEHAVLRRASSGRPLGLDEGVDLEQFHEQVGQRPTLRQFLLIEAQMLVSPVVM
jgi:hypothetical protein